MSPAIELLIPKFMLYGLLPVWVIAGAADYFLHRRTSIETTSGWHETQLHILQALQIGVPLLAGLFLEINSLVIAIMIACVIAHMLTALWDSSYTAPRRYISPIEQHVHSHMEYVPVVALILVVFLYWESFLGLLGGGTRPASYELRWKVEPLPPGVIATVLIPIFGVQALLLLDETRRTWPLRNLTTSGRPAMPRRERPLHPPQ